MTTETATRPQTVALGLLVGRTKALQRAQAEYDQALAWCKEQGLTPQETAEAAGMTYDQLRMRWSREDKRRGRGPQA